MKITYTFRNHWTTAYHYERFLIKITRYKDPEYKMQAFSFGFFNFEFVINIA